VNDEKVLPEDALAKALRGCFLPLEPSANFSSINRKISEFINFHILIALSWEQKALIVKNNKPVGKSQRLINSFPTA